MKINLTFMKRTAAAVLVVAMASLAAAPAFAADAASPDTAAETQAQTPADTASRTQARTARPAKVSLADAAATAEKMYYTGELYLFADSMIKTNYEMATIAATVKSSVQSDAILKNRSVLNALAKNYAAISDKYNSWVDVKGDLEFFINVIGPRNTITKSQLQTIFSRTVKTVNDTKTLLEKADEYYGSKSTESRRALTGAANNLTTSAAKAVNAISPAANKTLAGYRALFDQFAAQSGLAIEYKTWSNPEASTENAGAAEQ